MISNEIFFSQRGKIEGKRVGSVADTLVHKYGGLIGYNLDQGSASLTIKDQNQEGDANPYFTL